MPFFICNCWALASADVTCAPACLSAQHSADVGVQQGVLLCRQSAIDALAELREYAPDRQWRLIQVAGSLAALNRNKPHLLGESCCHLCF